jgi:sn-glycerol 3-phosphate transport system permease protein
MSNFRKAAPGLVLAFKIIIGILIVSPIILGLSFSFMSPSERAEIPPHITPHDPVISNYVTAVRSVPIFRFILNSLIVCSLVILGQIFTCSFGAYAFSYFTFPGRRFLFLVILSTIMIPSDAIIIANYLTISRLRLTDTYTAMVAPYLSSAMGIFLMRQFFLTIPRELYEAAVVDGCRNLRFLFSVVMPISKPAIASLGVYVFIQVYNQFLWPLLATNTNRMRTVQVGISILKEAEITDYGVVLAGSVLILIPAIFVFIIGQKYLVKGMAAGAVKG